MTFKVVNKYLQDSGRTFVAIRQEAPYTAFDRILIGDRVNESDEVLIEAVLGQVATELNPAEGVKKLQEDLHTQAQEYEVKLAEKDAKIAEVKAVADWSVLVRVTDVDNPLDPTLFKRGLELVDLGQTGKIYKPGSMFAIEDPEHVELNGEGKRILIQTNQQFIYQGESLKQLEGAPSQNGILAIWKWDAPKPEKPSSELETQPVQ